MCDEAISVVKTGATIAFNATSANVAIPTDSSGASPKYVRLSATANCYAKIGPSGVTAAAGDLLVQPAESVVLKVQHLTHIAALQVSAGGTLQISPLEDQ